MLPKITAVCVTYGRAKHLQESLGDFLAQDYDGPRQLVILNTFPQQRLIGEHPNVKIINCKQRPPSLGAARNMAIQQAEGEIICTWDDDDRYAKNHLANFGFAMSNPAVTWGWMDRQYYAEGGTIQKIVEGQMPCVAFRKDAWEKVGKYTELTVGEDRHFIGRLTSGGHGTKITIPEDKISFIYCWGNGVYHISGMGDDRRGLMPAFERARHDLELRIRQGTERLGEIHLTPRLKRTPEEMIHTFKNRTDIMEPIRPTVGIIELGRYGDIVNILPICRHIAKNYGKPHLMISSEFASILDGVSYVVPEPQNYPYDQVFQAEYVAKKKFNIVLRAQIWGKGHVQEKRCKSYNAESWRELGFQNEFFDPVKFPLAFDKRNPGREQALYDRLKNDKPMLLAQLTASISSPFPPGEKLLGRIRECFGEMYNIVDLASVQAERAFDLIGLMDRSKALVTIDSLPLHLAAASKLPVVALVNDRGDPDGKGWTASECRCNCIARITYTDAMADPEKVIHALNGMPDFQPNFEYRHTLIKPAIRRRIFHAVERHDDPATPPRKVEAWNSWDAAYSKGEILPAHYTEYKRDARAIGDRRDLPYLKDVLANAMEQANPEDIILWTNDDNALNQDLPAMLEFYAGTYGAVCSQRCDFRARLIPGTADVWRRRSEPHIGRDMFAFTKAWLTEHWDEIGDVLLGASIWDLYLCAFIRLKYGIETTRRNLHQEFFPADMPRGFIGHQMHDSQWEKESPFSPAEKHNRTIFRDWSAKHLPNLKFTPELAI
jgi:glycosyltransferase involved in cell wall biosynthesis